MKRFAALLLAIILTLSLAACSGDKNSGSSAVVSTENFSVTKNMLAIYFQDNVVNFYNNNYQYVTYFGLDLTKSLKDQIYYGETTWYDYFMTQTLATVDEMLLLAEDARAHGVEVTEDQKKEVDDAIERIKAAAEDAKFSFNEYITRYYFKGVTEKDLRDALTLSVFAYDRFIVCRDSITLDDNALDGYLDKHKNEYFACDLVAYRADTEDTARLLIEQCHSEEEFMEAIAKILKDKDPSLSDYQASLNASSYMAFGAMNTNPEDPVYQWIFADGRAEGDAAVIQVTEDNKTFYYALFITKALYPSYYMTKNVRHILFMSSEYESDEACKSAADEIYEKWLSGDRTESAFAALASEYSQDLGSKVNGGLYTNVDMGQTVDEFDAWIYDGTREPGDTEVIKTTYGYHIMYFVGDGAPSWRIAAESNYVYEAYEEFIDGLFDKYPITTDSSGVEASVK